MNPRDVALAKIVACALTVLAAMVIFAVKIGILLAIVSRFSPAYASGGSAIGFFCPEDQTVAGGVLLSEGGRTTLQISRGYPAKEVYTVSDCLETKDGLECLLEPSGYLTLRSRPKEFLIELPGGTSKCFARETVKS